MDSRDTAIFRVPRPERSHPFLPAHTEKFLNQLLTFMNSANSKNYIFGPLCGKNFFKRSPVLPHTSLYDCLTQCQNLEKN